MKRFLLAAALALTLHGLFFAFGPKLVSQRSPAKPRHLTVTFSIRQAPEAGPGPELEHPVPSPDEVVTAPEQQGEPPVVREEHPKEPRTPPEKAVSPRKEAPTSPPKARADVMPQKREPTTFQKRRTPKKKKKIMPSSPVETQPLLKETPGPEVMAEPAGSPQRTAVSPVEQRRGEHMGLLPDIPGLTGKVAPKAGEEGASVPTGEKIIKATPAYRDNPRPEYPKLAKRRGYEGTVLLEVLVGRAGKVEDLRIVESSGYRVLDRSAMRSVKDWLFEPGSIGGRKVDMWVRVPVRFELTHR